MNRLPISLLTLTILYTPLHCRIFIPNAFCSVPIADLLSGPIHHFFTIPSNTLAYTQLPWAEKKPIACPRVGQLLFNERVTIIGKKGNEVEIEVPHLQYKSKKDIIHRYWTLASNLTPLTNSLESAIPSSFLDKQQPQTIVLHEPFYDTTTHQTYSAGTRFLLEARSKEGAIVTMYNTQNKTIDTTVIPVGLYLLEKNRSITKKRNIFVQILKNWAHHADGIIPYVIGGCSVSNPQPSNIFKLSPSTHTIKKSYFFTRQNTHQTPLAGIDCAHIVMRAAQIAGIPLCVANTSAQYDTLPALHSTDTLQEGDIIYWTGHVAVISNLENNMLIEARSYENGYGAIIEIPFHEELKGIQTTQDLLAAYHQKKPISRLNKQGKKSQNIERIFLLKLME